MTKIPRRAIDRPGFAILFIKADAQPPSLLAQITFATRIHNMGVF